MAKKKTTLKEGIVLRKSSKGISVHLSTNGRKLAVMTGYNNRANAIKGILALHTLLANESLMADHGKEYRITDLTKPAKR